MVMSGLLAERRSHVGQAIMDQVAHELVRSAVVGEPAIVAGLDKAHSSQQRELMTCARQRKIQRPGEVPDSHLMVGERVHECEPDGIPKELEHLRRHPQHLRDG